MIDYLLVTNIYNEREHINDVFKMVSEFTIQPKKWLWIIDGSTDGSENEVETCAGLYDINIQCFILPPKPKGNLRTLGTTYNLTFDSLGIWNDDYDFMLVMDVDSYFNPQYAETIATIFDEDFRIGVVSGYNRDAPKLKMPQGDGKCVRWSIVQDIDKFWEPAIDTFLNIKARSMGYQWYIMYDDVGMIDGPPSSRNITAAGAKHAGWFWYYASGSVLGAINRMVYRIFKRRNGIAFMRGFLEGRRLGVQSMDPDVMAFYGRW